VSISPVAGDDGSTELLVRLQSFATAPVTVTLHSALGVSDGGPAPTPSSGRQLRRPDEGLIASERVIHAYRSSCSERCPRVS